MSGAFVGSAPVPSLFVGASIQLRPLRIVAVEPEPCAVNTFAEMNFAPGAMDAMLALALTLHIDPVFVGAHHLSRFIYVSIVTPGIVHLFGKAQDDIDD